MTGFMIQKLNKVQVTCITKRGRFGCMMQLFPTHKYDVIDGHILASQAWQETP